MNFARSKKGKCGLRSQCKECYKREKELEKEELLSKYSFIKEIESDGVWNHCPYCIKVCSKCGRILVANEINFKKKKKGKWKLASICKYCDKKYREDHSDYFDEYNKKYYKDNKGVLLEKTKKYYEDHKEERDQYGTKWYKENRETRKEKCRKYYKEHKEEAKEYRRKYYEEHKEEVLDRCKEYRRNNPNKVFNNVQKRRHKLENQGRGITKEQWLEMMNFFEWECAYSGIRLDENNRSIDHIISLSKDGENEPWNCVPMVRILNSSKYTSDMEDWYMKQDFFDIDRLLKIYEWIEYAYKKYKEMSN